MAINQDVVDFHSHILPGADHGSSSVSETLLQLSFAAEHSVSRVVATPHFYPMAHTVDSFLDRRARAMEELESANERRDVSIVLGAEVLICDSIERMQGIEKLFIGKSNTILLELPTGGFSESYVTSVRNFLKSGVRVVLAHADRYSAETVERLVDVGAQIQLNADALSKLFVRGAVQNWLRDDLVVALGSDIHGKDAKAYKRFVRATERVGEKLSNIRSISDGIWLEATK